MQDGWDGAWWAALLATFLTAAGAVAWILHRRRAALADGNGDDQRVMAGMLRSFKAAQPVELMPRPTRTRADANEGKAPANREPVPPLGPDGAPGKSIELGLEIIKGSRSFMQLTIEFSLDIANRSDRALRDVAVMGSLASVDPRGSGADASIPPVAERRTIDRIERIAPHQSRRVSGRLQLPLSAIVPLQQSGRPLAIPLLHIAVRSAEGEPIERSFVVGTPSTSAPGRVQPLPLDEPPGGLPPLRAQAIDPVGAPMPAEPYVAGSG